MAADIPQSATPFQSSAVSGHLLLLLSSTSLVDVATSQSKHTMKSASNPDVPDSPAHVDGRSVEPPPSAAPPADAGIAETPAPSDAAKVVESPAPIVPSEATANAGESAPSAEAPAPVLATSEDTDKPVEAAAPAPAEAAKSESPAPVAPSESTGKPAETAVPAPAEAPKAEAALGSIEEPVKVVEAPAVAASSESPVTPIAIIASNATTTTPTTTSSSATPECNSCLPPPVVTPAHLPVASFNVAPGQFLFDTQSTDSEVSRFARKVANTSVYKLFYAYTTIIARDASRCTTSFSKSPDLSRFADIPCLEENRVKLAAFPDNDFIHANYVDGFRKAKKYICAQAPMKRTMDRFWEMVWQEKTLVVVAMHHLDVFYYPLETGAKMTHGSIGIEHQGTRHLRSAYDATVLKITKGTESRTILNIEFFDWPHKCTPIRPTEVLNVLTDIEHNYGVLRGKSEAAGWLAVDEPSPIVVTCLTGVGRSASLITLDIIRDKANTSAREGRCVISVTDTITRLRTQRAMAVQPEQYVMITLTALEYAVRRRFIAESEAEEISLSNYALFPYDN